MRHETTDRMACIGKDRRLLTRIERSIVWMGFAGLFCWLNVLVLKGSGSLVLLATYMSNG